MRAPPPVPTSRPPGAEDDDVGDESDGDDAADNGDDIDTIVVDLSHGDDAELDVSTPR